MKKKSSNNQAPQNSGAYRIYLLVRKPIKLTIGKLGDVLFDEGEYIYTGSAMKNLRQRVERHRKKDKNLHWHIDYLLASEEVEIIKIDIFPSSEKEECRLNQELINNSKAKYYYKGFGSSDCRSCKTHLLKVLY